MLIKLTTIFILFQSTIFVPFLKDKDKPVIELVNFKKEIVVKKGQKYCLIVRIKNAPENSNISWSFIPNSFYAESKDKKSSILHVSVKSDVSCTRGLYLSARYQKDGKEYLVFDTPQIQFID